MWYPLCVVTRSLSTLTPSIWRVSTGNPPVEDQLSRALSVSPFLSRILVNRGIDDVEDARRLLSPSLDDLHDPFLLDGIGPAVARIREAVERSERIMVHGDYDVDGITATSLLVRVLKVIGADASWYVPHRQREGYDISDAGVDEAQRRGARLIITVDCGASAVDAIARARDLGMDVIVTDHHEVGAGIAPANILINPHMPGSSYPFKDLAGVGVAFKLGEALVGEFGFDTMAYRQRFSDLAAIGTVADIVPLLGENRALVKFGLEEIPRSGKKGIRALLDVAGISGGKLCSHTLAFGLCPRLNAAGRKSVV